MRSATSSASRVLPAPPTPASVSRRLLWSSSAARASCSSRPKKRLARAGSLRAAERGTPASAGLVDEDVALQLTRGGAGLEPELGEAGAEAAERFERLDLAAGAVEGQRVRADELLLVRLGRHQPLELGQRLVVAAELDQRADPALGRARPQLLEPADLGLGEVGVRDVAERRAAPEGERRS